MFKESIFSNIAHKLTVENDTIFMFVEVRQDRSETWAWSYSVVLLIEIISKESFLIKFVHTFTADDIPIIM